MVLGCQHPQGQAGVALQPEQPGVAKPAGDTCKNTSRIALLQLTRTELFRNKSFEQNFIRSTGCQYCELGSVDTMHTGEPRWLNLKYSKCT